MGRGGNSTWTRRSEIAESVVGGHARRYGVSQSSGTDRPLTLLGEPGTLSGFEARRRGRPCAGVRSAPYHTAMHWRCVANLLVWLNCTRAGLTCRNGIALHNGMCKIMPVPKEQGTGYPVVPRLALTTELKGDTLWSRLR